LRPLTEYTVLLKPLAGFNCVVFPGKKTEKTKNRKNGNKCKKSNKIKGKRAMIKRKGRSKNDEERGKLKVG